MYNIDFRVNSQILSIPICLNDNLSSLINRMKQLTSFRKYDRTQLQHKLLRCLKSILCKNQLDTKVRSLILELLNSQSYQKSTNIATTFQNYTKIASKNDNLREFKYQKSPQHQAKNDCYLTDKNTSQIRLNKKYGLKSLNNPDYIQEPLSHEYKYQYNHQTPNLNRYRMNQPSSNVQKGSRHKYDQIKRQSKVNVTDYFNKRKFSYNLEQNSSQFQRSIIDDSLFMKNNQSFSNINAKTNLNKSYSQQKILHRNNTRQRRVPLNHSLSFKFEMNPNQSINNGYNGSSKIDHLIDRTRSVSQVGQKDILLQERVDYRNMNRISSQSKQNAGKIQHRSDYKNLSSQKFIDMKSKQNYLPSRPISYNVDQSYGKRLERDNRKTVQNRFFDQTPLQGKNNNYTTDFKQVSIKPIKKVYSYL